MGQRFHHRGLFMRHLGFRHVTTAPAVAGGDHHITDIAKLNIANSAEEDAIRKAYIDLGKLYYAERGMAPEGAYMSLCEKII